MTVYDKKKKATHIISSKRRDAYENMLNLWERDGIKFKILKEQYKKFETVDPFVIYHIVKYDKKK